MDGKQIVKMWKAWCESDEGRRCLEGRCDGVYLRNRLERAFHAGIEAGEFAVAASATPVAGREP